MPMDIKRYPKDWADVSHRVRFERASGRCEWPGCGARHGALIERKRDGEPVRGLDGLPFEYDPASAEVAALIDGLRIIRVVLTTAHTCNCRPKCGDESHLLALCQLHHLRFDADEHRRNAAATRRRRQAEAGQGFLIRDIDGDDAHA